jgi:hypothetical protein
MRVICFTQSQHYEALYSIVFFFPSLRLILFVIVLFYFLRSIVTEEDADRVWSCVENAVKMMVEAEDDD